MLKRQCRVVAPVLAALVAPVVIAPAAVAQRSGKPLVEQVARAMGGIDRVLAVRSLALEGTGESYNLGQNPAPDAPLPAFAITEYRRVYDFAGRRWRVEQTREPRFVTANRAPQRLRSGFDSVAYDVFPDGGVRRAAGRADIERADELLYHPIGFIQTALRSGAELTEEGRRAGLRQVRMNVGGNKLAMFVDPNTRLPARINKIIYHPVLGDAVLETRLSEWREVDGVKLPMRIRQRLDGKWPLSDIQLTVARVNADVGDIAAPDTVRAAAAPTPTINVTVDTIAPGVWYLAGQSHHSVAIEMRDHLLLVEAPQSEARTIAVIKQARELRPEKPVRAVITTHHHFDHIGGVRAAISEGTTIITHERNGVFMDTLAKRRHYSVPDRLTRLPAAPRIETVGAKQVLSDGARTVELHHIRGNRHAETLLMVYLPAERLLIEADVYSPPPPNATNPPPAVFAPNLVENIDRLGLQVDRVVPIHGRVVPMSDLRAAAAAAAAAASRE